MLHVFQLTVSSQSVLMQYHRHQYEVAFEVIINQKMSDVLYM